jgi:hypothetical protein
MQSKRGFLRVCFLGTVMGAMGASACASDGNAEMNLVLTELRTALGTSSRPELVSLIVYAPRATGAPQPVPLVPEPGWDPSREARRIASWNGEDRMAMPVSWWAGAPVDTLRVQAVVATGVCGSDRTVLAEGDVRGVNWMAGDNRAIAVALRPVATPIESSAGCP